MPYRIEFDKWTGRGDVRPRPEWDPRASTSMAGDIQGYNAWDYLPSGASTREFATAKEARDWLKRNHLGKGKFGIGAKFYVKKNPWERARARGKRRSNPPLFERGMLQPTKVTYANIKGTRVKIVSENTDTGRYNAQVSRYSDGTVLADAPGKTRAHAISNAKREAGWELSRGNPKRRVGGRPPKGFIKCKGVRVVRKGGKQILEVRK